MAAYQVVSRRELRLGTHSFPPSVIVRHERLVELGLSPAQVGRLCMMGMLHGIPVGPATDYHEGDVISPSSTQVPEPSSAVDDGEPQEDTSEEVGQPEAEPAAGSDEGTEAETGGEDPHEPELQDEEGVSFDPAEHTVAEVQNFVEEFPDLRDAVLSAELDGRNRKTLVDWLAAG